MRYRALLPYTLLFLCSVILTPLLGMEDISLSEIFSNTTDSENISSNIFFNFRIPRTIICALCGGGLSLAGASFQAIFRNPLVEPYTLGIAGGAAVGAYISIVFPALNFTLSVFSSQQIFALCGAAIVMILAYRISSHKRGISPLTLLLGGLTLSIICSGIIVLLTYISTPHQIASAQRWMLGGFDLVGYSSLASILPLYFIGAGLMIINAPAMNVLNIGEEAAQGLGVDSERVYALVFIGGGILTADVVSLCGPIAFIGLVVPHIVRRFSGYDQRLILPASFFFGGALLCIFDMISRSSMNLFVGSPTTFPVGIITALIGGPMFIKMLYSGTNQTQSQKAHL